VSSYLAGRQLARNYVLLLRRNRPKSADEPEEYSGAGPSEVPEATAGLRSVDDAGELTSPRRRQRPQAAPTAGLSTSEALAAVAGRIPVEAVGLFIAGINILGVGLTGKIVIAVVCGLVAVVLKMLGFAEGVSSYGEAVSFRRLPWLDAVITIVAFIIWLGALPNSIFTNAPYYSPQLGGWVLLVGAVMLVIIDRLRQIRWSL